MVRTRKVRSSQNLDTNSVESSNQSNERWRAAFEMELDRRMHKVNSLVQDKIDNLDRSLHVLLSKIPAEEAKVPPQSSEVGTGYHKNIDSSMGKALVSTQKKQEGVVVPSTLVKAKDAPIPRVTRQSRARRTRTLSDSDLTEEPCFIRPAMRSSSAQRPVLQRTVTKYQTPSNKGFQTMFVTPKVDLNRPMPLKRYARQGEVVISLEGSPLMMATSITEPAISLPLNNGQEVYSIMPSEGTCPSLPLLDDETREKLLLLRQNLDQILQDS